jgi:hypothetical protein
MALGNIKGKVANLIQKNLGNLTGGGMVGLGGGIIGSLTDKAKNMAQTNAAAAKILNKSPLEINDTSPVAHMKENPYDYGTVYYPNNVQTLESGHYIIFDVLEKDTAVGAFFDSVRQGGAKLATALGKDKVADFVRPGEKAPSRVTTIKNRKGGVEERVVQPSSGLAAGALGNRTVRVSKTIVLYMPPGLKTSYGAVHEGVETGIIGNLLGMGGEGVIGSVADLAGRMKDAAAALGTELISGALAIIPGMGDLKGALTKLTGKATNPNTEMVFKSVPMRSFDFVFEFAPKNKKELENMYKILEIFKYHMHPMIDPTGNDFIVPEEFQITYMYLEHRNQYIPRVSRCVLTNLDVQHGDDANFSTFAGDDKGAAPIYTKMSLKFSETEIMTKTTISKGF